MLFPTIHFPAEVNIEVGKQLLAAALAGVNCSFTQVDECYQLTWNHSVITAQTAQKNHFINIFPMWR